MRRCTGVISTSWGHACSASCALASCNWRGSGLQDARRLPHSPVPNSPAPSPPCPHHAGRGNRGDQTPGPGPRPGLRPGSAAMPSPQRQPGVTRAAKPQLTLLVALAARFLPETRLLRMRRKDWRRDFFRDFTRDSGPSMARESLG